MKHLTGKKIIITVSLLLTMAFAAVTFATDDSSPPCLRGKGAGYHQGGKGFHGQGYMGKGISSISKEDVEKLQAECQKFHASTRDLRMELKSKRLAIKSELAKPTPNEETAMALQKELSGLEASLGKHRISHLLAMKKISPQASMLCKGCDKGLKGCGMGCKGMGKSKGSACPGMGKKQ